MTITVAAEARVKMGNNGGGGAFGNNLDFAGVNNTAKFGVSLEWELAGNQFGAIDPITCPVGDNHIRSCQAWMQISGEIGPVKLEETFEYCIPQPTGENAPWSQWYGYEETVGPYRLGVKYELIGAAESPQFGIDFKLTYAWFADQSTTRASEFAGQTRALMYFRSSNSWSTVPEGSDFTPIASSLWRLDFRGDSPDAGVTEVQFRTLNVNGSTVDTTDLADGYLLGTGGGGVDGIRDTVSGSSQWARAPYTLAYDLDPKKYGSASAGARVTTANAGTVNTPYLATHTFRNVSWSSVGAITSTTEALSVLAASATDDFDPDITLAERTLRIWGVSAIGSPATDRTYTPATVTMPTSLDVHRPDGATPSNFVASSGDIIVAEGANTTLTVNATGSHVTRTFGAVGTDLPEWRRWLGVGVSGKADALFNPDLEGKTKHTANTDIFDWSAWSYLRWLISAPAAGTLTLTLTGVHVSVSDTHTTGADRGTDFTVTETPFEVTYSLSLTAGANVVDVDLLFPATGASVPFYPGRIDRVKLAGFAVGEYVISGIDLVSKSPTTASFKLGFGTATQRSGNYDAAHLAHNGAAAMANLSDQVQCSEFFSDDGRGVRYCTILTGSGTGIIQDAQHTVDEFRGWINNVESLTSAYSLSAYEAANKDSFGNSLSPELAEWLNDCLPGSSFNAGDTLSLAAQPKCGQLTFVNGQTFLIRTRDSIGHGAVEVLAKTEDDERAPDGSIVTVRRQDNAVEYTGTTDAHGFAIVSVLPQDGSKVYEAD